MDHVKDSVGFTAQAVPGQVVIVKAVQKPVGLYYPNQLYPAK